MIKGYTHPKMFDRKKKSSIVKADVDVLGDYLRIALLSDKGELESDPNYGCILKSLLYNPNDAILADLVKDGIVETIRTYFRSIIVQFEDIEIIQNEDRMTIQIGYTLSDLSDAGMVELQILNSEINDVV